MKNLKISITTLILLITVAGFSQEQNKDSNAKKKEFAKEYKIAKEKLALTPEQEPKFTELTKFYAEKVKAVRNSESTKKEKIKEFIEIRNQKNDAMKALLSEDQYKVYLQLSEERKLKMKEMYKNANQEWAVCLGK